MGAQSALASNPDSPYCDCPGRGIPSLLPSSEKLYLTLSLIILCTFVFILETAGGGLNAESQLYGERPPC